MTRRSSDNSGETSHGGHLPFDKGERKKVMVVGGLVVVALVVVSVQVFKKSGPSVAQAADGAVVSVETDLKVALEQMRLDQMPAAPGDGKATFQDVDQALEVFLGGAKPKGVPVDSLRGNVFGVPAEFMTPPAPDEAAMAARKAAGTAAKGEQEVDPIEAELAELQLETCLVSARNRAAIINGQVLHCGEMVGGFKVLEIDPGRVTLAREGKQYSLMLR